jgi:Ni/Fe-hydrogenase subunit HybB-like protein
MIDKDFHPERTQNETFTQDEYMEMKHDLLKPIQHIGVWGKVWIGFLITVCLAGVYAYYLQETKSKYVTVGLRDYTMWGVYISNFVFFIALSMIGVLMSAVLKLANFEWYRPLSRIAEVVALAAICLAGISIVVAMGRPDRLHYLFIHARLQSPITWDIIVVITYVAASLVLLYIPMIPSLSTCRNHLSNKPKWQMNMYKFLSFGWEGNPEQWKILRKGVRILSIMIIPLGVAIQSVDAWLFATTLRPEWDSTNFSGYFISGAFLLATAAMIVATFVFRKVYKLEKYLTEYHFDKLGQAMVLMASIYLFFNINEYLVPAYKMSSMHANHLLEMFVGDEALMYWMVVVFGIFLPALLPLFPALRKPVPLFIIALVAVVAHWFKRYLIVIPGQLHTYLPIQDVPPSWTHYSPSAVELTLIAATFAGMLLIVTLFTRFFPIISVWEVAEGKLEGKDKDKIINYK